MPEEHRFDSSTERSLALAIEEARLMNHSWLGTEHLLLGTAADSGGAGSRVLEHLGVALPALRTAVEGVVGRVDTPHEGELTPIPRLQPLLTLAGDLAKADGRSAVAPQHLLLALASARDHNGKPMGVGSMILEKLGVTPERIKKELPAALAEESGPAKRQPLPEETLDEARELFSQWLGSRPNTRRYSLVMPEDLFAQVEQLAQRQNTTVVELLRRFTRLGLLAMQVQERPDAALILREGGVERQLLLL